MTYQEKFVAFIDILGFKELVKKSVEADDAESIARMVRRLGSDDDIALYREDGAEICPHSQKLQKDLSLYITQVPDCVIVSAEVSPAGAINIVNYCRKIAERLLLRESVLCRGYLTKGKVYHQGAIIFGPAYLDAIVGEKKAAAVAWFDGNLGRPFIEVDPAVSSYLSACGDECTRTMYPRMVIAEGDYAVISPYGIFARLIDWTIDPAKTRDEMHKEINHARKTINDIEKVLVSSKPTHDRAQAILSISFGKLSEARRRLNAADEMIANLHSPFPSPRWPGAAPKA